MRSGVVPPTIAKVEPLFDRADINAIHAGVLDANAKLAAIAFDIAAIRKLLEDGDDEEEEAEGD